MKKFLIIMLIAALGASASAQNISPYAIYKIKEGVNVEVIGINRVEKYGWDNFVVKYRLVNQTKFDIFKIDLTFYLVDEKDNQVGLIEVHDFKVPKNSDQEYQFVAVDSPYVNEKYTKIIVEKNNLEILVDEDDDNKIAKIDYLPNFTHK